MPSEPSPARKPFIFRLAKWVAGVSVVALLVSAFISVPTALIINAGVTKSLNAWNEVDPFITDPVLPSASVMLTADGNVIARFATYDRTPVTFSQISPNVIHALLATEDTRFYEHAGVDIVGLVRAANSNASSGSLQGGSTITQQYIKNVLLLQAELQADPEAASGARERSIDRKISEARKAIELENTLSKDEILTRYLNIVNFGSGAYGIEAAARRYYSTTAANLTVEQAAMLIGIINRPRDYDPTRNSDLATKRRAHVLDRMAAAGYITTTQAGTFAQMPLGLNLTLAERGCSAAKPSWGHYCDAVVRELVEGNLLSEDPEVAAARWARGGLTIVTALDEKVQASVRASVRENVPATSRAAAMAAVVEPGTGLVAALVVSKDYGDASGRTQLPLLTKPVFGPGSTMKVFTLAAAAASGMDLNTRLPGGVTYTSQVLANPASGAFNNYNSSPASNVTVLESVRRSLNTSMIQITERLGVRNVARLAKDMGATSLPLTGENAVRDDEGSFTLGARGVSVLEMANSYATVAAEGLACTARLVTSVTYDGEESIYPPACRQVMGAPAARAATYALRQVVTSGTGTRAKLTDRDVAGKTGTAQDVAAAWFCGFTPQWAMAVAIADPRGPKYPLENIFGLYKVYGGTVPAQIFASGMNSIHRGLPALPVVSELDNEYLLAQPVATRTHVPDVRGMEAETANRALAEQGFTVVSVTSGIVTGTSPEAGTLARTGAEITLVTGAGP
jgi:membrane peptidoglycan carboxypeptidase